MNKRRFLTAAALASSAPYTVAAATPSRYSSIGGPGLLTVTGSIARSNRPAFDPALDQLFAKQHVKFDKGFVFNAVSLHELPPVRIKPTLEYDEKVHTLSGPLLSSIIELCGVSTSAKVSLMLKAIDGYTVAISLEDAQKFEMIVATHIDDKVLALGNLGPLWAVYDADRIPDLQDKPLNQRFGLCPWGLYHVEVKELQGVS